MMLFHRAIQQTKKKKKVNGCDVFHRYPELGKQAANPKGDDGGKRRGCRVAEVVTWRGIRANERQQAKRREGILVDDTVETMVNGGVSVFSEKMYGEEI